MTEAKCYLSEDVDKRKYKSLLHKKKLLESELIVKYFSKLSKLLKTDFLQIAV